MWGPSSQGLLQAGSLICHLTSKWIPSGPSSCPMKVLNTQEEWEGEGREGRNGGGGWATNAHPRRRQAVGLNRVAAHGPAVCQWGGRTQDPGPHANQSL